MIFLPHFEVISDMKCQLEIKYQSPSMMKTEINGKKEKDLWEKERST